MKEKLIEILMSMGLCVVGVCLLLWAEKVTNTTSQIFGAILILYGLYNGYSYYKSTDRRVVDAIFAVILIVCGIILVVKPSIVTELVSIVIGAYIIVASIIRLRVVLEYKDNKNYNIGFWLSISGIVIGILCIVGKLLIPNIVLQFVGILLIIYSITNIINTISLPKKITKK